MNKFFKSGAALALYSSIFIGIALVILEVGTKTIGPLTTLAYVQTIGGIFLIALALLTNQKIEVRKLFSKYKKETIEIILTRNILGQVFIFYGFSLTVAIKAGFLTRFEPIFVAILGFIFLGEKIRKRGITAILVLIAGAVLLSVQGNFSQIGGANLGDILVVLAMVFTAYSFIPARKIKDVNSITITAVSSLIGGAIIFLMLPITNSNIIVTSLESWALIIGMAFMFNTVALYLYYIALKTTKAWVVASVISVQAVVSAALAYLFLNQTLSTLQIIGALIVMGASIFVTYESMQKKEI
jgi:drug/metabolite transporter (DMT)-like permease